MLMMRKTVRNHPAGIPDDDEEREGSRDTREFNDTMKEKVIHGADEVKGNEEKRYESSLKDIGRADEFLQILSQYGVNICHCYTRPVPDML